ncbi:hypothetical protein AB685_03280 [Bacillus sp. LL01]|uniref:hypothetical protein n=1 Tax=Bacillus sp. LL01 TaxID=1665556 RepID=UPI00064D3365|nr:hypothetical protein [Bacillus sp. LL01]KMJ59889.1 hypothetical protein AB685_03280 [Bacillus sp. LL01]
MFNGIILAILVVLFTLRHTGLEEMLYTFLFASMFFNIYMVVQMKKVKEELNRIRRNSEEL